MLSPEVGEIITMAKGSDRVWMIGWEYPPLNSGGLGVACQGLTASLSDQQTEIYFTLPYAFPDPLQHMHVVPCIHPSWGKSTDGAAPFAAYTSSLSPEVMKQLTDARLFAQLPQSELEQKVNQYADLVSSAAQTHQRDFEVVHAHDWMSFPAAMKVKQTTHRPYIAHVHSTEFDRIPNGSGSPYISHVEYEGMAHADRVIAVSHFTKRLLTQKYNIPANNIDVIHNGIDEPARGVHPGNEQFAQHRPVIVFMGRLTGQKGPEYFIQLGRRVLEMIPDALLVVAGSGDLYHQLLLTTAKQQLSASLLYAGFLRDQQRETLLDRADIFVMPSVSEPFGLVALEAAQHHTPVIISKTAGVAEVLPGAIAIDFWDIELMTKTISDILSDKDKRSAIVANQLEDVKKVTWSAAANKVKDVYRRFRTQ